MKNEIILIFGTDTSYFTKNIAAISAQSEQLPLVVIFPTDELSYHSNLPIHTHFTYQYACYLQGKYQRQWHFPLQTIECDSQSIFTHQTVLEPCTKLLITPDEASLLEDDLLEISLSPVQADVLNTLTSWGLTPNEELLKTAFHSDTPFELLDVESVLQMAQAAAEYWLHLPSSEWQQAWNTEPGERYRCLQDMQLWRYGLMGRDRQLLNQTIWQLIEDPTHWAAHLVLLLYKRVYRGLNQVQEQMPTWFKEAYEHYLEVNGGHLAILEPVQNFTVTIITPTYNRVDLLKRTVNSVLNQTHTDWKMIIGDGGSTDGTEAYCQELVKNNPKISYFRQEAHGPKGIYTMGQLLYNAPDTELVVCCCDDDFLMPWHLEKTVAFFKQHPWLAMVTGTHAACDRDNTAYVALFGPHYPEAAIADNQTELQRCSLRFPASVGVNRRSALLEIEPYDVTRAQQFGKDRHYEGPGQAYAIGDGSQATNLVRFFEVAFVSDVIACLRTQGGIDMQESGDTTAKMHNQADNLGLQLVMLEQVFEGYCALFGENSFPYFHIHTALQYRYEEMVGLFQNLLLETANPDELRAIVIEHRLEGWERLVRLRKTLLPQCSHTAPILIDMGNINGIPGYWDKNPATLPPVAG